MTPEKEPMKEPRKILDSKTETDNRTGTENFHRLAIVAITTVTTATVTNVTMTTVTICVFELPQFDFWSFVTI